MTEGSFRVGVIDLGTNAVRLQIAQVLPDRRHEVVAEEREVVRLGEGLFTTGGLSTEAIERTISAIGRFAKLARHARVHTLRAVATAAVREAHNRSEFVRAVARETGVALEVISGAEEARLICLGVLTDRALRKGDYLLCDIGGGSTELTVARRGEAQLCWSLEVGAVRLTELFLAHGDPPPRRDVERLRLYGRQALEKVPPRALPSPVVLVGSAGTIGALAEILRLQDGARARRRPSIARDALEELLQRLSSMPVAERRRVPGVDEQRAEIVVAGAALLLEVMDHVGASEVLPTRRGLRDGLVVDLIRRVGMPLPLARQPEHIVDEGLRAFLRRCGAEEGHSDRVTQHALALFEGVARVAALDASAREVLRGAAMLHDVGQFVGYSGHHKHSYYLISNAELPGYSDRERELIACVARYHRRSTPRTRHLAFAALTAAEQEMVRKLSAILRVADALDRSRRAMVQRLEVRADDREVRVTARVQGEAELERWAVEEKAAPVFEEALGLRLRLEIRDVPTEARTG